MHKVKSANKIQKIKRTDIFSKEKRSEVMSKIRSKETKIEKYIGKVLWSQGFRYRKNNRLLMGNPDFSNQSKQVVIFVDSCFWHGCENHFRMRKSNKIFWKKKITRNKERDFEVTKHYKKLKWKVIRVWEHDLANKNKIPTKLKSLSSL